MIVVAVTSGEVDRMRRRLSELGAVVVGVAATGGDRCADRRVVTAETGQGPMVSSGDPSGDHASIAARLRGEGEMAAARPDGGAALRAWQRDTAPAVFGGRVSVCLAVSEHDRHGLPNVVELGPGGFGNGRHPSTRLAIEILTGCVGCGERVLDVGCGSGILGLAALALGAGEVAAVDRKPEAVAAAERSASINGWADRLQASSDLTLVGGRFDLVLANIARDGIAELAGELVRRTDPAGRLVVSGITPGQSRQVAGYLAPLRVAAIRADGDWAALVMTRNCV